MGLLEEQSEAGTIDIYYGDETQVSESGYVPYGWQFKDEEVAIPACRGRSINCFGLLSRDNDFHYEITENSINSNFVIAFLDSFSLKVNSLGRLTVVVLDNASIHTSSKFKALLEIWKNRGLYIFYLPPYSPKLNIIERLWKELKEGWIKPSDYKSADQLFYAVNRICAAIGKTCSINFSKFNF